MSCWNILHVVLRIVNNAKLRIKFEDFSKECEDLSHYRGLLKARWLEMLQHVKSSLKAKTKNLGGNKLFMENTTQENKSRFAKTQ